MASEGLPSQMCFTRRLPQRRQRRRWRGGHGRRRWVSIDAAKAEVMWCCYAWLSAFGNSVRRTFIINQGGDVLGCHHSGTTTRPTYTAALDATTSGMLDRIVAANTIGNDGEAWVVVN
jgi:hypothetical protein